ncbi:MAG: LPS export ABC transporter periplasmic protein LptC [Bdellovibrionaceae bacterium]|nr:LPS export ABC transporter periplasmic protein LptC [Pseudobdellovibrionaceae bacterium]
MSKFRNPIFLVLLTLLFVEVLIVFPHQVEKQPAQNEDSEETAPQAAGPAEQKAEGVHLVESQGSSRDWELFAKEAEGDQAQNWRMKDVRVLFYSDDKIEFTVTGQEGSIDVKSRDMQIRGNVQTVSTNGYRFFTQDVKYDAKTRRIVSPTKVKMNGPADKDGPGIQVEGQRMMADVGQSRMQISSNIVAQKPLAGGKSLRLSAESAEFSGKSKQAEFKGKVVMKYGETTIEGPEAKFFSSAAGDLLSNIQIEGGVKVTDANKFATSEALNLDIPSSRFVFTGQPKVYQDQDELAGERIIFLDGGKKVKVESVRAKVKESP